MENMGRGSLSNQVAVVTGGTSGIGEAMVRTLVDEGASVAIVDVNVERARELADSLGQQAVAVEADVSVHDDAQRIISETVDVFGKATILVNSAAPANRHGPALEMPTDTWANVISVILTGSYLVSRALAEQVIRQGGGGRIINIVSTVVERPRPNASAYCSAKSGLVGLTKALALEFAQHGINVNAVGPGLTLTPTVEARNTATYNEAFLKQVPLNRLATSQEIADAVLFLVSPAAKYVTGQTLYIDGGYSAGNFSVVD